MQDSTTQSNVLTVDTMSAPTSQGSPAQTGALMAVAGRLKDYSADVFKQRKPWTEVIDKNAFSKPQNLSEVGDRSYPCSMQLLGSSYNALLVAGHYAASQESGILQGQLSHGCPADADHYLHHQPSVPVHRRSAADRLGLCVCDQDTATDSQRPELEVSTCSVRIPCDLSRKDDPDPDCGVLRSEREKLMAMSGLSVVTIFFLTK